MAPNRFAQRRLPAGRGGLFAGREQFRLTTALLMLVMLWFLIDHARKPQTWQFLTEHAPVERVLAQTGGPGATPPPTPEAKPTAPEETVIEGPRDDDPKEREDAENEFQAIEDRTKLTDIEMPAYRRFLRWTKAQTFREMQKRAQGDVLFGQLYDHPESYRGELLQLRLHVRRVLKYKPPKDQPAAETLYEAWGWTDDSKSYPYVVVFPELPPQMKLGAEVHEEAIFVGYFLKVMKYEAFDNARGAPLLIGRLRWRENTARIALSKQQGQGEYFWIVLVAGTLILGVSFYRTWTRSRRKQQMLAGGDESAATAPNWLEHAEGNAPFAPESEALHPPRSDLAAGADTEPALAPNWLGEHGNPSQNGSPG